MDINLKTDVDKFNPWLKEIPDDQYGAKDFRNSTTHVVEWE